MAGGKIREALAVDRDVIAKSLNKGIHHAQIPGASAKDARGLRMFQSRNSAAGAVHG
jgi:hypothetical protein